MNRYNDSLARTDYEEPEAAEIEAAEPEAPEAQETHEEAGQANDPVRLYLKKLGAVPLRTREGEVAVGKRMAEGKRRVLFGVLSCPPAVARLTGLREQLLAGKGRIKDVVSDLDIEEEDEANDEAQHVQRVVDALE